MTCINKQKFIAELSKLLTFMYDEDREDVLAMYNKMFDDAADEQALIQQLVSPTRQAVIVARAYNSKERGLAVRSREKDEGAAAPAAAVSAQPTELPDYARVVSQIQEEARAKQEELAAIAEQEEKQYQTAAFYETKPETEDEAAQEEPAELPEEPEDQETEQTEEAELEEIETEAEAEEAQTDGEAEETAEEEIEPAEQTEDPAQEEPDKVEKIIDDALAQEDPAMEKEPAAQKVLPEVERVYVRKARVFPLILYIIAAIPIAVIGIVVLLIPAFVFLALAAVSGALGAFAVYCAIGVFEIFADLLLILGAALVLFALAVLFLWLFIWFIGGAIVGLIRGIIHLAGKWCYKEVAVA